MEDDHYLKRMDKGHEGGLQLWDPRANFFSTELCPFINSPIPQPPIAKLFGFIFNILLFKTMLCRIIGIQIILHLCNIFCKIKFQKQACWVKEQILHNFFIDTFYRYCQIATVRVVPIYTSPAMYESFCFSIVSPGEYYQTFGFQLCKGKKWYIVKVVLVCIFLIMSKLKHLLETLISISFMIQNLVHIFFHFFYHVIGLMVL